MIPFSGTVLRLVLSSETLKTLSASVQCESRGRVVGEGVERKYTYVSNKDKSHNTVGRLDYIFVSYMIYIILKNAFISPLTKF